MSVRVRLDGIHYIQRNLQSHVMKTLGIVAKKTPTHIINNITGKPMGSQFGLDKRIKIPANKRSTINAKIAAGKTPVRSLVDTGKLTSKSTWTVGKISKGWKVGLKPIRKEIARFLQEGGTGRKYIFMKIRKNYIPAWMKTIIKVQVKSFFGRIK